MSVDMAWKFKIIRIVHIFLSTASIKTHNGRPDVRRKRPQTCRSIFRLGLVVLLALHSTTTRVVGFDNDVPSKCFTIRFVPTDSSKPGKVVYGSGSD